MFVVDTDVLITASGAKSLDPRSVDCLGFLNSILEICHSVVVSGELEQEWDDHPSRWSNRWRAEMEDSRKISRPEISRDAELRQAIKAIAGTTGVTSRLEKDAHLVEACRQADMLIASNDNRARRGFARCASDVNWLGDVVWVNPATDSDLVAWLKRGAPHEESMRLSAESLSQP